MQKIFITGTDTEIGKTKVACALVQALVANQQKVAVHKPIASGCDIVDGQLTNADAVALMQASNLQQGYVEVNPFAFEPAIAPHIAAEQREVELTVEKLCDYFPRQKHKADVLVTEGAGGWLVPLNYQQSLADYVIQMQYDIVLVVGIKLGCINHALLTAETIVSQGGKLLGWVANLLQGDDLIQQKNIETLAKMMPTPLLGKLYYNAKHIEFTQQGELAFEFNE